MLKKAFGSFWHNAIMYKLSNLKVNQTIIKWISDFLTNRTAQLRVNKTLSKSFRTTAGVPQGSVLLPLLYIIFVSDIPFPSHNMQATLLSGAFLETH